MPSYPSCCRLSLPTGFLCGWVLVVCSLLSACSNLSSPAGAKAGEILTDSDEPDARRRARLRLELALGYYEQGKYTYALDETKQSIVSDPSFADAHNVRGLVYMRLNDLGLAEDSFKRALSLRPNDGNILHNYGWLLCQQSRYADAERAYAQALALPNYSGRAKTWLTQGLCQTQAGKIAQAEVSFTKSFELDAANPVSTYNLALLLYQRGDFQRAQFYIRRLNSGPLANVESLWLGVKIERRLGSRTSMEQLSSQLRVRYPKSREVELLDRGAFDE
jgi:type IV pilus assembly protein PilF